MVLLAQEDMKRVWSCWFRMAWSCKIIFVFLVRDDVVLFTQEVMILRVWSIWLRRVWSCPGGGDLVGSGRAW